jgi:hypothetical protein
MADIAQVGLFILACASLSGLFVFLFRDRFPDDRRGARCLDARQEQQDCPASNACIGGHSSTRNQS